MASLDVTEDLEEKERFALKVKVKDGSASAEETARFRELKANRRSFKTGAPPAPLTDKEESELLELKAKVGEGIAIGDDQLRFEQLKMRDVFSKQANADVSDDLGDDSASAQLEAEEWKEAQPGAEMMLLAPSPLSDVETKERMALKAKVKSGCATPEEAARFEELKVQNRAAQKYVALTGGEQVERKKLKAKIEMGVATDQETVRFEKLKMRNRMAKAIAKQDGAAVDAVCDES